MENLPCWSSRLIDAEEYTSSLECARVGRACLKRSFNRAVSYQEGRKVRNARRYRAMLLQFTPLFRALGLGLLIDRVEVHGGKKQRRETAL